MVPETIALSTELQMQYTHYIQLTTFGQVETVDFLENFWYDK